MKQIRYFTVFLLTTSILYLGLANQVKASPLQLNDAIELGDMLSLNITGNEFTEDIDGRSPKVLLGDRQVSAIWSEALFYPIGSFGETKGQVASIYGENEIYFLLEQDLDDISWISMQWDTDQDATPEDMEPMAEGDDMWVFGETEEVSVVGDGYARGTEDIFITSDPDDNLLWEKILVNDTSGAPSHYAWEVKRSLDTADTVGADVVFSPDTWVSVMFASNLFHKQDNSVMNFSLSADRLGGELPVVEVDVRPKVDVTGFMLKHISIGLLISMGVYIAVFGPTLLILRNQKRSEVSQ